MDAHVGCCLVEDVPGQGLRCEKRKRFTPAVNPCLQYLGKFSVHFNWNRAPTLCEKNPSHLIVDFQSTTLPRQQRPSLFWECGKHSPLQEPFAAAVLVLGVLSPRCQHTGNSATWKGGQDTVNRERYQQRHGGGSQWQAHGKGAGRSWGGWWAERPLMAVVEVSGEIWQDRVTVPEQ